MRSFNLLALFPLAALAAINGPCTGPPDGTASGYYLTEGICLDTSDCVDTAGAAGKTINGGCPFDGNGVKCCLIGLDNSFVNPCGGESFCGWNNPAERSICTSGFDGTFKTGHCPGPNDYQCCLADSA